MGELSTFDSVKEGGAKNMTMCKTFILLTNKNTKLKYTQTRGRLLSMLVFSILVIALLLVFPAAAFAEDNAVESITGSGESTVGTGGSDFTGGGFDNDTTGDFTATSESGTGDPTGGFDTGITGTDTTSTQEPAPAATTGDSTHPDEDATDDPESESEVGDSAGSYPDAEFANHKTGSDTTGTQKTAPGETADEEANRGLIIAETDLPATYFQVTGNSMNPRLQHGSMVEIVSETYADGDMVVAQTADGTYIIKTVSGDRLVSEGTGLSFALSEVTILGVAVLSSLTAADLEAGGLVFSSVLGSYVSPIAPEKPEGSGTEVAPYLIASLANLYWITAPDTVDELTQVERWAAGIYYKQTANIDATPTSKWFDQGDDNYLGWTPIAYYYHYGSSSDEQGFSGVFDGNGFTINNLYINRPDAGGFYNHGLFGYTYRATLTGIALENVNVTGRSSVGGLVGNADYTTISGCYATGSVTGTVVYAGGLVGISRGTAISDSYANCIVAGKAVVGGLVGDIRSLGELVSTIRKSYAEGNVEGEYSVGGLVGDASKGLISDSHATGDVTGCSSVGGLVGTLYETNISDSYATGDVTGCCCVGGLVGDGGIGTISNSYATGDVTGTDYVGGLVGGEWANLKISNSYAIGAVKGTDYVGGLVGYAYETEISNSYAIGAVKGTDYVGGLVGYAYETEISNSYAIGKVTGTDYVGGLIGEEISTGTAVTNCFYDSETTTQNDTGKGTPKTTAKMKTLSTFTDADWNITGAGGGYPLLGWQVNNTVYTWVMGENGGGGNGDDNGDNNGDENGEDNGDSNGRTPGSTDPGLNFGPGPLPVPAPPSGSVLTNIPGQSGNAIINPDFVTGGSAADLGKATEAYNQAKSNFEANKATMSAVELAVTKTELAVAYAAILALEKSLAAQSGGPVDIAELIAAYQAAKAELNNNRALLTADQISEAEALLKAIATVISRFSS